MLNAHPLFVHYPIALLTAALLFEVLWLIFRRESLFHAATAALVLGAVGALAAAASGLQAGAAVPHEVPGAHVEAVVAGCGRTRRGSEVPEIAPRAGCGVVVVSGGRPRHR